MMEVTHNIDQDTMLRVVVELANGVAANVELARDLALAIRAEIERVNSEFLHYAPVERRTPVVELFPPGHPEYFPVGVKHGHSRTSR